MAPPKGRRTGPLVPDFSGCSSKLISTIVELLLLLHSTILLHYYCVSRSSSRSLLAFEWGVTDFVQDFTKVLEGFTGVLLGVFMVTLNPTWFRLFDQTSGID